MLDDRSLAYLRLNLVPGVGPILFARLLEAFEGDPRAIFAAPAAALQRVPKVGAKLAAALRDSRYEEEALAEAERAAAHGVEIVTLDDEAYPPRLRETPDPPPVLYVRGRLLGERDELSLGIVGSRQTSYYGRDQARRFGSMLARTGLVVVSGFARGIDTAAHEGALQTGGRTIAVIGSGLLDIYPPENRELVEDVVEYGAVISEFPLKTAPQASNFPRRNRIIAGMTLGTLVIESGLKSGAMITARQAGELGRDVFAIPGRIDDERTRGCHSLIKQGAKLVEDLADILDEIAPQANLDRSPPVEEPHAPATQASLFDSEEQGEEPPESSRIEPILAEQLTPDERAVLEALTKEPTGIDLIAQQSKLPIHKVTATLTLLEVKGHVRQLAGRHYMLAR